METWKQVGENLVRYQGGTIYLRAKVAGKVIRVSLETTDLRTAKRKRDLKIEQLRKEADLSSNPHNLHTVGDALELVSGKTIGKHGLKAATTEYYQHLFTTLRATLPVSLAGSAWSAEQAASWWKGYREVQSSQLANTALRAVRKIGDAIVSAGLLQRNPTTELDTCRVARTTVTDLPSVKVLDGLIASVGSQKKRCSKEASQMIEFLAWSGMRINELRSLLWEDVGKQWLTITGGEIGTKNHEIRRVPLNPRLTAILRARRHPDAAGPVFSMVSPREALSAACTRLGVRHMRVHDLRHWFASRAIESGVDIPTVALWLGHKDGGVLAMKTYGHIHDDHSLKSMKKMGRIS